MKDCRNELLRKKNAIVENLKSTELSLLDEVKKNPRFWSSEGLDVRLTTQTALVLTAEVAVPKPSEKITKKQALNSAVQLLFHIDVFRQSINRISGHYRCLQEYCVYCHVKSLLCDYESMSGKCKTYRARAFLT